MDQQLLSSKAQAALAAVNDLSQEEQEKVVLLTSANLAAKIAGAVQPSTPEQRTEASSKIRDGIQAALAHGFKQVKARDGTAAIEVEITRPTGIKVTCLLSEGARGKWYRDLADYGKNELKGVTLLSREDFTAVVEHLFDAIKSHRVVKDVLQTEDAALEQAYQIVTQGVRRVGGFSWAVFKLDEGGAVADRRVDAADHWRGHLTRFFCALFGASLAEFK